MENDLDIIHGAEGLGDLETDFLIEGEIELPPLFKQNDIRYEYSQGRTPHCTLYSSFGALSDLIDKEMTPTDIKEIIDLSVKMGKPLDKGWHTNMAVKCVAKWYNEKNPDNKVAYFRLDVLSNNFDQVLNAGYTIIVTYRGNKDYGLDLKDGVLDGTNFTPFSYGHCVSAVMRKEDGQTYIKDNYKGRKGNNGIDTNVYKVKHLKELVENGVFYGSGYLYLLENNIKPNIEDMKRLKEFEIDLNNAIALNSKLWFKTNDEEYKAHLETMNNENRRKLEDIKIELQKLV